MNNLKIGLRLGVGFALSMMAIISILGSCRMAGLADEVDAVNSIATARRSALLTNQAEAMKELKLASEDMGGQAAQLQKLMEFFKIEDQGKVPGGTHSAGADGTAKWSRQAASASTGAALRSGVTNIP